MVLATQSPRKPLAPETGERCFISPIDQLGLTGTLLTLLVNIKIASSQLIDRRFLNHHFLLVLGVIQLVG